MGCAVVQFSLDSRRTQRCLIFDLLAVLIEVSQQGIEQKEGIDIAFQNLQLEIKVTGKKSINVVDDVTGRIRKGTMTAIMGGSGAGKTSLLNALCGRANYGKVHGKIFINGNLTSMENFAGLVGFVPQDDIVYAELTVRENFIFSGRFRLPRGTPRREIEELADTVLVQVGLARKASSLVGDVTHRGVSGGEKKRVNVGIELMSKPGALFLDEPTSGLDSSSALTVMKSLHDLVQDQGVTVCTVIHQPRKFIFNLFDSIIVRSDYALVVPNTFLNSSVYSLATNTLINCPLLLSSSSIPLSLAPWYWWMYSLSWGCAGYRKLLHIFRLYFASR